MDALLAGQELAHMVQGLHHPTLLFVDLRQQLVQLAGNGVGAQCGGQAQGLRQQRDRGVSRPLEPAVAAQGQQEFGFGRAVLAAADQRQRLQQQALGAVVGLGLLVRQAQTQQRQAGVGEVAAASGQLQCALQVAARFVGVAAADQQPAQAGQDGRFQRAVGRLACQAQGAQVVFGGAGAVFQLGQHAANVGQRIGGGTHVALGFGQLQAHEEVGQCIGELAHVAQHAADVVQQAGFAHPVAQLAPQRQAPVVLGQGQLAFLAAGMQVGQQVHRLGGARAVVQRAKQGDGALQRRQRGFAVFLQQLFAAGPPKQGAGQATLVVQAQGQIFRRPGQLQCAARVVGTEAGRLGQQGVHASRRRRRFQRRG